ncbi:hypothetical protein D4R71_00040 [bacterium]|nr:MAG: hypothetical protein D4R71_00040 [bacterium]
MTLIINTTTPEGIVIATDSRQSYRNRKGISRIGSDTAKKLFKINNRVGVAISGLAFIENEGVLRNVSTVIDNFIESNNNLDNISVKEITEKLYESFSDSYNIDKQFKILETKIKQDLNNKNCKDITFSIINNILSFNFKDRDGKLQSGTAGIEQINFLVAVYNTDNSHEVYTCFLPGDIQNKRDSTIKGKEYGASWMGQTDLVTRIILGFDPRIGKIEFIKSIDPKIVKDGLRNLEYSIQWGTMTLQDGVDFSDLMIKTTSALQRFSDGILAEPGDMPGVGGEVDIAVITKKFGFKWINKKLITYQDRKIEINEE